MRLVILSVLSLAIGGCAASRGPLALGDFDPATVRSMALYIDFAPSGTGLSEDMAEQLEDEISGAFSMAGYAVVPGTAVDTSNPPSHQLRARVDALQRKAMPRGFTLTFGNADPRSQDFQKANVRPIACSLEEGVSGRLISTRTEDYIDYGETSLLNSGERAEKLKAFYFDNIGATCHELLMELAIESSAPKDENTTPINRSPIRMEIIDEPQSEAPPESPRPAESREMEKPPAAPAEPTIKIESATPPEGRNEAPGMLRKQIKIFNKGDTVILKFGNERR